MGHSAYASNDERDDPIDTICMAVGAFVIGYLAGYLIFRGIASAMHKPKLKLVQGEKVG